MDDRFDEYANTDDTRARALWVRFTGIFGGDAVVRKFGEKPPQEWVVSLNRLGRYDLKRGMRRLMHSGKAHVPTLPEFLRWCRESGGDHPGDQPRASQPQLPPPPMSKADGWKGIAGVHLLGYLSRQAAQGVFYAVKGADGNYDPKHKLSRELTKPLVEAKNAWAANMVEAEEEGSLPTDHGRAWWDEAMQNAEKVVVIVRAEQAAAGRQAAA